MRLDDRVTVATPESVSIELVLAGLGSRFLARLLDTLIQLMIIIALVGGAAASHAHGSVLAVVFIGMFLTLFIYDVPFEVMNGGRTIGKMAAGIRVVEVSGGPISLLGERDPQPDSHRRLPPRLLHRRLDLDRVDPTRPTPRRPRGRQRRGARPLREPERFSSAPITVPPDAVVSWDVSAVDGQDLATIRHFLDRRLSLPWPVRLYFANAITARVGPHVAGLPANAHPEYVLEGIVVAKQRRA